MAVDLMLHHIGEHDEFLTPTWFEGGALTVTAANGNLSTTALEYTRLRFEAFIDAIVNGAILLENEALNVANVEAITTYSDGSAITAGKYHRLLLGVIVGTDDRDFPFIIVRQGKPGTEYATLAAAENDSERKSASSFPAMYQGVVLPLYYINMLLGDASDLSLTDIRPTGIIGNGGGGAAGVTDHGLLSGLGDDDHLQYLRADGTRTLTGNMTVTAGVTVDGVDISAHVADAAAHHALVTLGVGSDAALSLAGQELTLADVLTPVEHTAIGNGAPHHAAITLAADADILLGLTGQQIGLDTQTANRVLAGPETGAASDPTFRALVSDDIPALASTKISDFTEAAQDAVGAMVVNGTDINLTYVDATPSLTATLVTNGEIGVILANGVNNNVNIGTALLVRVTGPTGAFSITGFTGGYAGRQLFVYNTVAQDMTATNEGATSAAANRILTLGGGSATNQIGCMHFIYSGVDSRWILASLRS